MEKRIEEAVPAGQQLQELGMRLRCEDTGSENVSGLGHAKKSSDHWKNLLILG